MLGLFFIGLAVGTLAAVPVAWGWSKRTAARVRQLEQRARTAERLAELGTMTGGLAHEIKNPLSTVGLNIQLVQEDLDELREALGDDLPGPAAGAGERLGRVSRRIDTVRREADRLRDILEDFLRFAGRVELDLHPTDLNAVVEQLTDFFQPQAEEMGVRLRCDLASPAVVAPADGALLKQALLNLLINACQAMAEAREKGTPHGGADELLLRTERAAPRPRGSGAVTLHVTDTGPGLPEGAADRIFQPYYSTKRGGSGLGLPTSRRIVEEHGGTLTVHSEHGRGSDFVITLPAT